MEGCKIKYGDVKDIFSIVDITDKYLLVKNKEIVKKVYIYEVEPVTFLNFSIDVQSNILNLYSEFLHELNLDFQIYISNKKINIQKYISNLKLYINKNGSKKYLEHVNNYISSISRQLESEKIYTTKFYLVISINSDSVEDINSIDNIVRGIENIGCNIKRIISKRKLQMLMYDTINKEVVL